MKLHEELLFVRQSRGLVPTPKTNEIMQKLAPALMEIQKVLQQTGP